MRALLFVCAVLATLTSLPLTASATVEEKTWGAVKGLYRDSASTKAESSTLPPLKGRTDQIAWDWIRYPINPWLPLNGLAFGASTSRGIHCGDDCVRSAGTPVYAVYGGNVQYVRYHAGTGNWGWIVIVESQWNNLPFCTVYGHLSGQGLVGQGMCIPTGARIGFVGTSAENGGHTPHLHLGIHYGYYGTSTGTYPWWCRGYGGSTSGWFNPTNFIAAY